ncbi:IclR family transcriptional regulator C-terminal domain-containing protein [Streptomyces sp. NPDC057116]|uniref:IclR family transcriptional regulator domain-containing protein n=1 Tax=Streptomyces sp. NPDC057116 TaxID=3346023 RepID=UPI003635CD86
MPPPTPADTPPETVTRPGAVAPPLAAAPPGTDPSPEAVAPPPGAAAPPEAVAPLMRGIAVLRALTEAGGVLSASALERATGLPRATVDRVTATLARMGYVRLDGRDATLAPRLMELGNAYLAAIRLPGLLGALADELDESVSLAVPDRDGIRLVHQATRRRAMSLSFRIGDPLPAERTAPGDLFAAGWTDQEWTRWRERRGTGAGAGEDDFERRAAGARRRGWAVDDQRFEPGLVALAVPVRAPDGRVVCAVSVVSHTSRHGAASLREAALPRLRAAVREMERTLREAPPPAPAPPPAGLAAWTGASKQELGRDFVESLARGLTVLTAFGEGRESLTLSAVAEATGLARATARRALITLEHLGYVTAHDRTFRPAPRVLGLGYPPLSRTTLPAIAAPHLAALATRVHDSASLAVLDGDDIRYTARVATGRIMSVDITVGTRFPAYATSMGRVLLAELAPDEWAARLARSRPRPLTPHTVTDPEELAGVLASVAASGYALVDEELEEGLRSVAVPVRDRAGRAVAAVNVAMHSVRRTTAQCVDELLPELRATADRIEADLHVAGRFARIATV